MLDKLQIADFARHLNQTFRIHVETPEPLAAELIEVSQMGSRPEGEEWRQAFSVVFRGPAEPILPQRIYRVEHEELGSLDLFLVPLGPDKVGVRYEAVFT